jgi:hypothetical protein
LRAAGEQPGILVPGDRRADAHGAFAAFAASCTAVTMFW